MPTHAIGDWIVVCIWRNGSTTPPTVPSSQGWVQATRQAGQNTAFLAVYVKRATATNHTTGTWTSATGICIAVIRGASSIGTHGGSNFASSTTITYPAVTLDNTAGGSIVLGFAGAKTTNLLTNTPTGYSNVTGTATQNRIVATSTVSSNVSAQTQTITTGAWISLGLEFLADTSGTVPFSDSFPSTLDTAKWVQSGQNFISGSGSVNTTGGTLNHTGVATYISIVNTQDVFQLDGKIISSRIVAGGSSASLTARFGIGEYPGMPPYPLSAADPALTAVAVKVINTTATAYTSIGGTDTAVGSTRTHTNNDYYRISLSGGTITWETSTNGTSWSSWTSTSSYTDPVRGTVYTSGQFAATGTISFDEVSVDGIAVSNPGAFFAMF